MIIRDKYGKEMINMSNHWLTGPLACQMHVHPELEISGVAAGTGIYRIGDREYDILPGDVFLLPNTDSHGLLLGETSLSNIVIHFQSSFIWNSLSNDMDYDFLRVFFERGPHFSHRLDRDNPATKQIFALILEILEEFQEEKPCYELLVKIKLQTIFALIVRHYDYISKDAKAKPLQAQDVQQLNRIVDYIDQHLSGEIRLAQLADIAHMSPAYFSTMFKRFNGLSPIEYIVHKRVEKSIEYIRTTTWNLTTVAMACGFNNSTNFYKAFHKVTGRTPLSYREEKNSL